MASEFFILSEAWRQAFPGAHAGVLAMANVDNPETSPGLDIRRSALETELRTRYAGMDRSALKAISTLRAYERHYRRFDKTYHVQLQLESILLKGKPIPGGAALVEAMFMAEVNTLLLTAGHDLEVVQPPLVLDVARGTENYVLLRGTAQAPKAGDMMISDSQGIISSIVYGPDQRTQIRPQTRRVVFTVYAPAGIEAQDVRAHLDEIHENVKRISPSSRVELSEVYPAS